MAKRHPNKEISDAIEYAISNGWRFVKGGSHAYGQILCQFAGRDGCRWSVFSTPKNPRNHAKWIRRRVDSCPHQNPENGGGDDA